MHHALQVFARWQQDVHRKGSGKDKENCTQLVFYRFKDSLAAHRAQCKVGIHIALVYGDYTKELGALAEALDVEPLFVE